MLQQRTSRTVLAIAWCAAWVLAQAQPRAVRSSPQQPSTRPAPYHLALNWAKLNDEAIEKLSQYIRLVTLNPPGMESKGVEWLKKVFEAEGIAYEVAEAAHGRGNIVARLKGAAPASQQRGLILLSHIDVVPVNHEFWTVDPFSGEVRDGYIWGRGAIDMKAQAIAQLMAFLLLHRAKLPLNRDVIFLATADEEAGGEYGAGWVVKYRPQWIAGAGFLLNEVADSVADDSGKALYFGVGLTEKTPAWLKLRAKGPAGHGSIPLPNSAVNRLVAALERLRAYDPPLEITPPIERALRSLAPFQPEPWRSRFTHLRNFLQTPGARQELAKRPRILALLQNTTSITGLEGTNKINIIPPAATALLDCRLLPGWTADRWLHQVRKILSDDSIEVQILLNFAPTESPVDSSLYDAITQAIKQLHPEARSGQASAGLAESISTGFTDSHFFRERGIISYGFEPFALTETDSRRAHGNDERIPVKGFTDGVRLMWEVVYNFTRGE